MFPQDDFSWRLTSCFETLNRHAATGISRRICMYVILYSSSGKQNWNAGHVHVFCFPKMYFTHTDNILQHFILIAPLLKGKLNPAQPYSTAVLYTALHVKYNLMRVRTGALCFLKVWRGSMPWRCRLTTSCGSTWKTLRTAQRLRITARSGWACSRSTLMKMDTHWL